jgi:2-phospho-L-lactate guanylyltransferase
VYGALPFRGDDAKGRLAGTIGAAERRELALALLDRARAALLEAGLARVAIVTAGDCRVAPGDDARVEILRQRSPGLNGALRDAQAWALAGGAAALLIVLPDLPLIVAADVRAVLDAGRDGRAVLATDRHDAGSNALLLTPPDAIAPAFGEGSAARHRAALAAAGIPFVTLKRPALALDLDTPDDMAELEACGVAWRDLLNIPGCLAEP